MKTREELLAEQNAMDSGGISQFLAGLGASVARQDPTAVINDMRANDQKRKQQALQQYDQEQALSRQTTLNQRDDADYGRKLDMEKAESDPMSQQSMLAQELAVKMGMDPEKAKGLSASKFKAFSPALEKMYSINEKSKSDKLAADERAAARSESAAERADRAAYRKQMDAERADYRAQKDEEKAGVALEKRQAEDESKMVPGYGYARDKKEAADFRQELAAAEDSMRLLEEVKLIGTDVGPLDFKKKNDIDTNLNKAIGGLRISLVGPGPMTDSERAFIKKTIGDPSKLFSTEELEKGKLDTLIKSIKASMDGKARVLIDPKKGGQTAPVNEVERATKDGRTGIFDANTKQFIRWK